MAVVSSFPSCFCCQNIRENMNKGFLTIRGDFSAEMRYNIITYGYICDNTQDLDFH